MGIVSEKIDGKLITVTIQSSNLKESTYNTETEDLTVIFNNGSIYEYNKVPWNKFTKFRLAESQGKYFNENIAKSHKYVKKG
jgi:lysyl-tRNA synthetase class 2